MAHPLLASTQEVLIVPLLPMALVAPHEMEKNVSPLYRYGPEPGGGQRREEAPREGLCIGCFCLHSCQGEVLASRKDFRMNTCTPHPRGAFMLEPVGISPVETLLPRNRKGEGLDVGAWEGRVPCACACQPWSHLSPQAPALKMGLLVQFPSVPALAIAGSAPGCLSPVPGLCSSCPALGRDLLGEGEG